MLSGLIVTGVALAAFLTVLFISRFLRLAVGWGAVWGLTFGFWAIAPLMVRTHHLSPTALSHWLVLDGFFVVVFTALGAAIAAVLTWPIAVVLVVRKISIRDMRLAAAFWTATAIPAGYLGLAAWIEWTNFARPPVSQERQLLPILLLAIAAGGLALSVVYRRFAERTSVVRGTRSVLGVGAAMVTGVIALLFTVPRPPSESVVEQALEKRADTRTAAPLLVIGLDGGNWATLDPLIRQNATPTLAAFAEHGLRGEIEALWPPYWSGPAWGAIFTGHSQAEIGVHEDLAATAPGLPPFELPLALSLPLDPMFAIEFQLIRWGVVRPMPMPRSRLRRTPIWERLAGAGVKTSVIRFPYTYPAMGQASVVVSNLVSTDLWEMAGVSSTFDQPLVSPATRADDVLQLFSKPHPRTAEVFREIFPGPEQHRAADALVDPLDVLRKMIDINEKSFEVATRVVKEESDLGVAMVHIGSFDNICHAFWQYRFPEQFPGRAPQAIDAQLLGPVIDRYLIYLDGHIRRLIEAFPTRPNVIVVADHGQEASPDYPLWKGWHSRFGVFLAAGPDVPATKDSVSVSYYDIVPTILDLLELRPLPEFTGRSVLLATK